MSQPDTPRHVTEPDQRATPPSDTPSEDDARRAEVEDSPDLAAGGHDDRQVNPVDEVQNDAADYRDQHDHASESEATGQVPPS